MSILNKVLWEGRGKWQMLGASIGIFTGLFLLLFAFQIYLDLQVLVKGARDTNILVLNKTRKADKRFFDEQDIQMIQSQPFFDQVSPIYSNQYTAAVESNTLGFYSLLFFQTVPNQFLEVDTSLFSWKEGDKYVPVVISKDYLDLYNYGFAPSQGLPSIPVSALGTIDFTIKIAGNGKKKEFDGLVCGATKNVNSILVPQSFMDYTNRHFGEIQEPPSQVIVSVENPYSSVLLKFLEDHQLGLSLGGLIGGELRTALQIVMLLVAVISFLIIGLSMLVFVLNFQLLIAQAQRDIQLLIQLAYDDWKITRLLARNLLKIFGSTILLVLICLPVAKYLVSSNFWISEGYENISLAVSWQVWLSAFVFCAFFLGINLMSIRKTVRQLA